MDTIFNYIAVIIEKYAVLISKNTDADNGKNILPLDHHPQQRMYSKKGSIACISQSSQHLSRPDRDCDNAGQKGFLFGER